MKTEDGHEISLGDLLYCRYGYSVFVNAKPGARGSCDWYGSLYCEPGHPCEKIPYSLNNGKDHFFKYCGHVPHKSPTLKGVISLSLYAIRNKKGEWLRTRGYCHYGEKWVSDIQKAKLYPKISVARSQVTWWATNYPDYGQPELVELLVTDFKVLPEEGRVKKAIEKKERKKAAYTVRRLEREKELAIKKLQEAQKEMERLHKSL